MLWQLHFIAFKDIKSRHFSNVLRDSAFTFSSCTRQLAAQEWSTTGSMPCMWVSFVGLLQESVS